jgi:hypothetical protein
MPEEQVRADFLFEMKTLLLHRLQNQTIDYKLHEMQCVLVASGFSSVKQLYK